jgi:predicted nucleic acid-binding protein
MILVDANLLIYAVNQDLPPHPIARSWWESTLSGGESVGIPWVVILAFVRICTHGRVFAKPLSPESAISYIDEWLLSPRSRRCLRARITGMCCEICWSRQVPPVI